MVVSAVGARSVEGVPSVSTGGGELTARNAVDRSFVIMVGSAVDARSAEEAAFASTDGSAIGASSVQQLRHMKRHLSASKTIQ